MTGLSRLFSGPLQGAIDYHWTTASELAVDNDTRDLYRFFDATTHAEYLYDRVAETVRVDLKQELAFLEVYDAAHRAVTSIVDMPHQRAGLLVRILLQNGGRMSNSKRKQFDELQDSELQRMEAAVQSILGESAESAFSLNGG